MLSLLAGLRRFGFDRWGCGPCGEECSFLGPFEELLLAEAIESCLVTDVSGHDGHCFLGRSFACRVCERSAMQSSHIEVRFARPGATARPQDVCNYERGCGKRRDYRRMNCSGSIPVLTIKDTV